MSRKAAVAIPAVEVPAGQVYFNVKTASEYLGITISAVRHELVYSKAVPYIRVGCRIIFRRADLDAFMTKRLEEAVA
jgi:excisionase family DNA binding protein